MFKSLKNAYLFIFLLNCLRAFKWVRNQESEKEILKELNKIYALPLCSNKFKSFFFSKNKINKGFQCALSQKIFSETLDKGLASLVMLGRYGYKKPVIMPYPLEWRQYLQKHGVRPHFLSRFAFMGVLFRKLQEALSETNALWKYRLNSSIILNDYVSFIGVPLNALKPSSPHKRLDNFLTYVEKKFPQSHLLFVGNSFEKITEQATLNIYPFPSLSSFFLRMKFIGASFLKLWGALLYGIFGKWAFLYMLKDTIIAKYVEMLEDKDLPKEVIFLNSYYIYEPLWALILEQRGVRVSLLFYATNTYNIQFNKGDYGLFPGYQQMSWKKFYTFHENHKKFIEKVTTGPVKVEIEKDGINMVDSLDILELQEGPKLALFDVQPFRDSFLALIGRPTHLYTYDISKAIFEDVLEWCLQNKVYLIVKPKREVNNRLCPFYKKMLDKILMHEHCIVLDSKHSPKAVCEKVDLVVCQPFTSVALFAQSLNKPVAYYDVTKSLKKNQPACQGVSLLQGKKELYEFLNASLKKR